jgi:transposase
VSKPYAYPSDVTDEEWAFVLPYLLLSKEDSGSRTHSLRAVFDAYRYLLRAGCGWRMLPGDFPPWKAVYDQAQRWHAAGVFEALIADLRGLIRVGEGRSWAPSAAVLDSRTLKSTATSEGAAYDGAKRVKGRKLHLAVDTLGHLLAAVVSPADAQDRAVVAELCGEMQAEVAGSVTAAFVDQGYTGAEPAMAAAEHGIELLVVKHAGPKRGFVLLPRRWVVERTFAWMTNFRRLNRDYERLAETLRALHVSAHAFTLLTRALRDQRRGTRPKP